MKQIVFLLLIMTLRAGAFAETLTLEDARTLALANSRSLAQYNMQIRTSILDERNQLYSMLPSLSADYTVSMSYLDTNRGAVNPVDTLTAGASFSITQVIFQGGKSFIQKAISSIATESVRLSALGEYFSVLDTVDSAYYAVLESAASLEAAESSLQTAVSSLSIAEIRQASGMINAGDYMRALAEKEDRENTRNQARRNLSLNMTKFKVLAGITDAVELQQIDFSSYEDVLNHLAGISDEEADALYEEFYKLLVQSNPSFARASLSSRRAENNLSLTKKDFFPTISVNVFSTRLNYSTAGGFSAPSSGGVTIRGSIPVDFWVTANRIERSRIARDSAALDFIGAELQLESDLQTALLNAITQAETVLSSRRSLQYTENHFQFVMERYRLSQGSVSDLGDASTSLINSRNSHIRASYGFLQSLSRLRSLGVFDDEEKLMRMLLGEK